MVAVIQVFGLFENQEKKGWNGFLNLRNLFMKGQRNQSVQMKVILNCLFFLVAISKKL